MHSGKKVVSLMTSLWTEYNICYTAKKSNMSCSIQTAVYFLDKSLDPFVMHSTLPPHVHVCPFGCYAHVCPVCDYNNVAPSSLFLAGQDNPRKRKHQSIQEETDTPTAKKSNLF